MFYRTLLAAFAAVVIATPVFADDMMNANTDTNTTTTTTTTQTTEVTKVNLNTATAKELMAVKGLNASKARAIVHYRTKNGNFTSTDDLAKVKGFKTMKPSKMKNLMDQLTVE